MPVKWQRMDLFDDATRATPLQEFCCHRAIHSWPEEGNPPLPLGQQLTSPWETWVPRSTSRTSCCWSGRPWKEMWRPNPRSMLEWSSTHFINRICNVELWEVLVDMLQFYPSHIEEEDYGRSDLAVNNYVEKECKDTLTHIFTVTMSRWGLEVYLI